MRTPRYALALSGLMLASAGAAFGQVPTPPPTPPAETPTVPAGTNPLPSGQQTPSAPVAPAAGSAATPVPTESVPYGAGMKINISPDGSKYLRFLTWHQVWSRYTQNNTGTLRAPGKPQAEQVDFALRRSRMIVLAQLNPRFLVYTHIGINNQTAVSGGVAPATDGKKPQLFVHEAVVEYKVNKYMSLGAGMHYQNGLSRMTRASTVNFLTMDAPLTNWPTIEAIDQFVRGIGVYAKGRVSKLDYAFSVNESFLTNQAGPFSTAVGLGVTNATSGENRGRNVAEYNPQGTNHVYQGYLAWEFLEQESNLLPFNVGTYLGTKRVFNLGGGFFYNADGMVSRPTDNVLTAAQTAAAASAGFSSFNNAANQVQTHDIGLWSLDAFFDTPINKESGTAFTAYAVYYNYDMGPNHVRFIGASNPGYGTDARRGNAVPHSGTGQVGYVQAGFLLPKNLLGPKLRVQPYASHLLASYEGLRDASGEKKGVNIFDAGANFYVDGHNAKFTINYRARPDFTVPAGTAGTAPTDVKYRPEITLQTQVFL
ncbi:hypothetical protein I2I05_16455 [Hymenobacter sp. BT683]|uniref:Porin n=1 Tax=Hymenobacter jeongseonensis TaxID=2791027 RepID=A0ABS0IKT6_9BACT|nr:hypothetical protein [Hymenobacter jeongseonensis]MBF9238995.1 hypothetical protein [Hymenobacter jeongseonensis]